MTLTFDLWPWPSNLYKIWWSLMSVSNFRSVGPSVQSAECKQTHRQTDTRTLPKILPLLLTREVIMALSILGHGLYHQTKVPPIAWKVPSVWGAKHVIEGTFYMIVGTLVWRGSVGLPLWYSTREQRFVDTVILTHVSLQSKWLVPKLKLWDIMKPKPLKITKTKPGSQNSRKPKPSPQKTLLHKAEAGFGPCQVKKFTFEDYVTMQFTLFSSVLIYYQESH